MADRLYEGNGAWNGRCRGRRRVNADHLYEGLGVEDGGCWSKDCEVTNRLYDANRAEDGRKRSICTKKMEQGMGGSGAFVRYFRSGGWEDAERLYGTFGAEDGM